VKSSPLGIQGWKDAVTTAYVTVFFLGFFPLAPGTLGSVPAVLAAYWLHPVPGLFAAVIIIITATGVPASSLAEKRFNRTDPREICIDEVAGMLIALYGVPYSWPVVVTVFFLYRIFDILKPFPAYQVQSLPGGFGIMLDDVVAGIYANVSIRVIIWLLALWLT